MRSRRARGRPGARVRPSRPDRHRRGLLNGRRSRPAAGHRRTCSAPCARVVVDEAHATGVIGPGGRGLVSALGLEREVDVVVGTLSKALGSYGAFAYCDRTTGEFLVNRARTLIFSTALPPPSVAAALAAVRIVRDEPAIVERLRSNARLLRRELAPGGFAVAPGEMPIVPLVVGDPRDARALCEAALRSGVFAQAIRPPTVPEGTSRLRVVTMAAHAEGELRSATAPPRRRPKRWLLTESATPFVTSPLRGHR
ncbi:MAG: aminotransferase class I/II-fold pyridoxal phosphate-dependent enzyme [Solirubrobacteraceae bacterium]